MKIIIKNIALICLVVVAINMQAQENLIEQLVIPLSSPDQTGELKVGLIYGSITVAGYSGKEIIIDAVMVQNKIIKSRKDGLTKISSINSSVRTEENNNRVSVYSDSRKSSINLNIKVPKNFSLYLSTVENGDIIVDNVNGEFEIKNVDGEITMTNISGSLNANTTNGKLKINFNKIDANTNIVMSSYNGDIDITLPKNARATIKSKSDKGNIYSDFDMAIEKGKPVVVNNKSSNTYRVNVEQWVYGKINGGGPEISMQSIMGNIIVRMKQ